MAGLSTFSRPSSVVNYILLVLSGDIILVNSPLSKLFSFINLEKQNYTFQVHQYSVIVHKMDKSESQSEIRARVQTVELFPSGNWYAGNSSGISNGIHYCQYY